MSSKDFLVLILTCLVVVNSLALTVTAAHVRELRALHEEDVIEARFLSRKIEELHDESDGRFEKMECQVDLAVAGFRMGHSRAYRMMRAGLFETCKEDYFEGIYFVN